MVISTSAFGDVRREQLALPGGAVLGHLAGVAAGALDGVQVEVMNVAPIERISSAAAGRTS